MLEALIVGGIVLIAAAVSLPAIASYIRNYKIRSAAQQVASQIQTARAKAIMKNVNLGVIWLARTSNPAASTWVVEDDLMPPMDWTRVENEQLNTLIGDPVHSPGWQPLPQGITFDNPSNCRGGVSGNAWGMRMGRLGSICQVGGSADCAVPGNLPSGLTNVIAFGLVIGGSTSSSSMDAMVCVREIGSELRRRIRVTAGGRVTVD